jgi:peptide/nickel transport system permease protein
MSAAAPVPEIGTGAVPVSGGARRSTMLTAVLRTPSALLGGLIVAAFLLVTLLAPVIAPFDPNVSQPDGLSLLGEPLGIGSENYILGTDALGRDMLSRLAYGSRVALVIALVPNLIAMTVATIVGLVAGYARGRTELVLMRITETVMVLPAFLIALALIITFGASLSVVVVTLGLVTWTYPARVVYGEVVRLREEIFVESARAVGAGPLRIIGRHLLPQLRPLLVVYFTLNAAFMVLLEAGLGYLGFGVQPPTPSWGSMISDARDQFFYPWLIIEPGVCLALLGIGFYLLGDGLARALGPVRPRIRL